jgi:deazaflavin-dependent oxidoreductase (nitroreductase family)
MSDPSPAGLNDFNRQLIEEFRANGGAVTGHFQGAPLLLLNHTGAKSGIVRTSPLVYTRDGDRFVIIASKGGAPSHPDWYRNVTANPRVTVEVGSETFEADAEILAEGTERDRLYDQMASAMPNFRQYQENTDRVIPVVVLTRA